MHPTDPIDNAEEATDHDAVDPSRTNRRPLPNLPPWSHIPAGWTDLLDEAVAALDRLVPGYRVRQVKEKFGLRIYWDPPSSANLDAVERASEVVAAVEHRSQSICDICGVPGRRHDQRGSVHTRCEAHVGEPPRDGVLNYTRTDDGRT